MTEYIDIQMRLSEETIKEVDSLKELWNSSSRTSTVAHAIRLAQEIFLEMSKGARVILIKPDGFFHTLELNSDPKRDPKR